MQLCKCAHYPRGQVLCYKKKRGKNYESHFVHLKRQLILLLSISTFLDDMYIAILKINIIKYILFSRISNENYQKKINKLSVKISSKLEKKHPFHKLFVVILNWIVNSILDQKHLCSFGTEIKLDVHLHALHLFLQSSHQRTWEKNHWKSRCIH